LQENWEKKRKRKFLIPQSTNPLCSHLSPKASVAQSKKLKAGAKKSLRGDKRKKKKGKKKKKKREKHRKSEIESSLVSKRCLKLITYQRTSLDCLIFL
jgi:hypothetical protein